MRAGPLRAAALLALAFGTAATPARACRIAPPAIEGVIHLALPERAPPGAIIADVAFEDERINAYELAGQGLRARVRRMIQGHYTGAWLIVRRHLDLVTDCERPGSSGHEGLIVAWPSGYENGVLVVEPIMAQQRDGYVLRNAPARR